MLTLEKKWQYAQAQQLAEAQLQLPTIQASADERTWWSAYLADVQMSRGDMDAALKTATQACAQPVSAVAFMSCLNQPFLIFHQLKHQELADQLLRKAESALDGLKARQEPEVARMELSVLAARAYGQIATDHLEDALVTSEQFEEASKNYTEGAHIRNADEELAELIFEVRARYIQNLESFLKLEKASELIKDNARIAKLRSDRLMQCEIQALQAGHYETIGDFGRARATLRDNAACETGDESDHHMAYWLSMMQMRAAQAEGRSQDARAYLARAGSAIIDPKELAHSEFLLQEGILEGAELSTPESIQHVEDTYRMCTANKDRLNPLLFQEQISCTAMLSRMLFGTRHAGEAEQLLRGMQAQLPKGSLEWGYLTAMLSDTLLRERRVAEAEAEAAQVVERVGTRFGRAVPSVMTASGVLATCSFFRQDFASASGYLDRAISDARQAFGPDSQNLLDSLRTRSDYNIQRRNGAEAVKDLEEVTRIQSLQGGEHAPDLLSSLEKLEKLYDSFNDPANVEKTLLRMEQVSEKGSYREAPARVLVPTELARFYAVQKRKKDADRYFRKTKEIADRDFSPDSPASLRLIYEMARASVQKGEYREAETLLQSMVATARASDKVGWRWSVMGLIDLAAAEGVLVKSEEQEKFLKQAWSIASRQPDSGVNDSIARNAAVALLGFYTAKNRVEEARQLRKDAKLDDLEESAKDPQALLNNFEAILAFYQSTMDVENALKWAAIGYEKASQVYGASSPATLPYLRAYQQEQANNGDGEGSIASSRRILALVMAQAGEHSPEAVFWQILLAGWLANAEKLDEATQHFQAALPWMPTAEKQWSMNIGQVLYSYGKALSDHAHYRESQPVLVRSLKDLESALGLTNEMTLQTASALTFAYRMDNRSSDAAELLDRIRKRASGVDAAVTLFLSSEQQLLDSERGDWKSSLKRNRDNQDNFDRYERRLLAKGSEERKIDVMKKAAESMEFTVSLYLQKGHSPEEAYQVVLRSKALVQEAQRAQFAQSGETVQLRSRLQTMAREIAVMERSPATDSAVLAAKQQEYRELDNNVAEATYGPFVRADLPNPKQVLEQLPPGSALLEFLEYAPIGTDERHYALFYLQSGNPVLGLDIGPARVIDALGAHLRDALAHSGNASQVNRWGRKLYDKLFGEFSFDGITHLYVSPDGLLNMIPFEVLRPTDNSYLVQRLSLSYLGTGRDLLSLANREPSRQPAVAFVAPDFDKRETGQGQSTLVAQGVPSAVPQQAQNSRSACPGSFSPLTGAKIEGQIVSRSFSGAQVYNGAAATAELLKQLKGPRVLHLSTHGFVCNAVADKAGSSDYRSLSQMYKSGVAMAGANRGSAGILTAAEIALMDLRGTQLAVLSACETGLGAYESGEGVMGLRRAFAIAGARAQLFSLWDVSDASTARLMADYYDALSNGDGHAESLRQVKLRQIQIGTDPYFWASFVAYGDPGPLGK
jgi:CHAT domain-containing protein